MRLFIPIALLWAVGVVLSQGTAPRVLLIEDETLVTATITDPGATGIGRLRDIIVSLGAQVEIGDLSGPIDEDIDLVVLIGPQRSLSSANVVRLYAHLERGGSLLLATDPSGPGRVNVQAGNLQIFADDYGVGLQEGLLVEPWFQIEQVGDIVRSFSFVQAFDFHPVSAPLAQFDIPVAYWGGRPQSVEFYALGATGVPLLYTDSTFAETARINFNNPEDATFQLNLGEDPQGRLLLAGLGERAETGGRIALFGDSEIFRNIFGLTADPRGRLDGAFIGDRILVERTIAWLLRQPFPPLPDDITYLGMDGQVADWGRYTAVPVLASPPFVPIYRLLSGRALFDDQFLFLRLDTQTPLPAEASAVELVFSRGNETLFLVADASGVRVNEEVVTDAAVAFGPITELRIPRRYFTPLQAPVITQSCVNTPAGRDCLGEALQASFTDTVNPLEARAPLPIAWVQQVANVRATPNEAGTLVVQLGARERVNVLGRSQDSRWLRVQRGNYSGWSAAFLYFVNTEIEALPVIVTP